MANKNNETAVSPIVATLVLIVVAVVGTVAIGTILGTFSSDVSKQANEAQAADASSTNLLLAGTMNLYDGSENVATDYQAQNPGIKINVQGGNSPAGMQGVAMGYADFGETAEDAFRDITNENSNDPRYQNIESFEVGGKGLVWATNTAQPGVTSPVTAADLYAAYLDPNAGTGTAQHGSINAGAIMLHQEEIPYAMKEEFMATKFLGMAYNGNQNMHSWLDQTTALAVPNGNDGMLAKIQTTPNAVGFLNWGSCNGPTGVTILAISQNGHIYTASKNNIINALHDTSHGYAQDTTGGATENYPQTCTRNIYYITKGHPSSVVENFINYARSPGAAANDIHQSGVFGYTDYV